MSEIDQKQFLDAMARVKAKGSHGIIIDDLYTTWYGSPKDEWVPALHAINKLAMYDMLPALEAITFEERQWLIWAEQNKHVIGDASLKRIMAARFIVEHREIADHGLPEDEVNDGRQYLGCTRLDKVGVQQAIDAALARAKVAIANGEPGTEYATLGSAECQCCGEIRVAWTPILVHQRRVPGASLIANLAAAAHYMLARFHVCSGKASKWGMDRTVDGYDEKKRGAISNGDRDLRSMALTGNRPFPPDFAIRSWAYKGAEDGEVDRLRCNPNADVNWIPDVNGQEG